MKKLLLLIFIVFISLQTQAQNMSIPSAGASNTLFLKFSNVLNGDYSYVPSSNISKHPQPKSFKPVYLFFSDGVTNASMSVIRNYFYATDPEEFAYIDPTLYNSVSLSREQLVDVLKTKTVSGTNTYLDGFNTIYLIDYEQKNPSNPNQVKILKVKPHYNFLKY